MLFADIPYHTEIKQKLTEAVKKNHVAHAQLFTGPPGSAKLGLALAYVQYINCEDKQENDACGVCPSCYKFNKYIHPDLHFVFPYNKVKDSDKLDDVSCNDYLKEWRQFMSSHLYGNLQDWAAFLGIENKTLFIKADEARNIIRNLSLKSFEAEYKTILIWLPEEMRKEGYNAILKILEEPPEKTLFLLVSEAPDRMLTTILSRTQKVYIPAYSDDEIKEYLINEKGVDAATATKVAFIAEGNLNLALRKSSEESEDLQQLFRDWMRLCVKLYQSSKNIPELLEWTDSFSKFGKETQKSILTYGLKVLRETLICKTLDASHVRMADEDVEFVKKFSQILNDEKIEKINKRINEFLFHLDRNANVKMAFMDATLQIGSIMNQK